MEVLLVSKAQNIPLVPPRCGRVPKRFSCKTLGGERRAVQLTGGRFVLI